MPARFFARITCDFLRPAPVAPLSVKATVVREGRSAAWLQGTISTEDRVVATAIAVALRRIAGEVPATPEQMVRTGERTTLPGPESGRKSPDPPEGTYPAFHNMGMEVRFVEGSLVDPGPAVAWFRLAAPLVAGEIPSPLVRVAAGADFSNGASSLLPWEQYTVINPDLTMYLHREPVGSWIGLDAVTKPGRDTTAVSESHLYDETGPIGVTLQSVLLDPLEG